MAEEDGGERAATCWYNQVGWNASAASTRVRKINHSHASATLPTHLPHVKWCLVVVVELTREILEMRILRLTGSRQHDYRQ